LRFGPWMSLRLVLARARRRMQDGQGSSGDSGSRSRTPLVLHAWQPRLREAVEAVRVAREAFEAALELLALLGPRHLQGRHPRLLVELDLLAALELPLLRQVSHASAGSGMPNFAFDDLTADLPHEATLYLVARGFTTPKLIAMVATTEDLFVEKIVAPYVSGCKHAGAKHKHIGDADLICAQMVSVWSDAREALRAESRRLRSRSQDRLKNRTIEYAHSTGSAEPLDAKRELSPSRLPSRTPYRSPSWARRDAARACICRRFQHSQCLEPCHNGYRHICALCFRKTHGARLCVGSPPRWEV
jgi:hypothetical protein